MPGGVFLNSESSPVRKNPPYFRKQALNDPNNLKVLIRPILRQLCMWVVETNMIIGQDKFLHKFTTVTPWSPRTWQRCPDPYFSSKGSGWYFLLLVGSFAHSRFRGGQKRTRKPGGHARVWELMSITYLRQLILRWKVLCDTFDQLWHKEETVAIPRKELFQVLL